MLTFLANFVSVFLVAAAALTIPLLYVFYTWNTVRRTAGWRNRLHADFTFVLKVLLILCGSCAAFSSLSRPSMPDANSDAAMLSSMYSGGEPTLPSRVVFTSSLSSIAVHLHDWLSRLAPSLSPSAPVDQYADYQYTMPGLASSDPLTTTGLSLADVPVPYELSISNWGIIQSATSVMSLPTPLAVAPNSNTAVAVYTGPSTTPIPPHLPHFADLSVLAGTVQLHLSSGQGTAVMVHTDSGSTPPLMTPTCLLSRMSSISPVLTAISPVLPPVSPVAFPVVAATNSSFLVLWTAKSVVHIFMPAPKTLTVLPQMQLVGFQRMVSVSLPLLEPSSTTISSIFATNIPVSAATLGPLLALPAALPPSPVPTASPYPIAAPTSIFAAIPNTSPSASLPPTGSSTPILYPSPSASPNWPPLAVIPAFSLPYTPHAAPSAPPAPSPTALSISSPSLLTAPPPPASPILPPPAPPLPLPHPSTTPSPALSPSLPPTAAAAAASTPSSSASLLLPARPSPTALPPPSTTSPPTPLLPAPSALLTLVTSPPPPLPTHYFLTSPPPPSPFTPSPPPPSPPPPSTPPSSPPPPSTPLFPTPSAPSVLDPSPPSPPIPCFPPTPSTLKPSPTFPPTLSPAASSTATPTPPDSHPQSAFNSSGSGNVLLRLSSEAYAREISVSDAVSWLAWEVWVHRQHLQPTAVCLLATLVYMIWLGCSKFFEQQLASSAARSTDAAPVVSSSDNTTEPPAVNPQGATSAAITHHEPAVSRSTNHIRWSQVLRSQEAETKSKAHEVVNSGGAAAAAVPAGSDWSDGLDGYADVPSLTLESFGMQKRLRALREKQRQAMRRDWGPAPWLGLYPDPLTGTWKLRPRPMRTTMRLDLARRLYLS